MTDKQRLAVMAQLANNIPGKILTKEQIQEITEFQPVVLKALEDIMGREIVEEDSDSLEAEMEVAAIEYLFKEMKYFIEKYT